MSVKPILAWTLPLIFAGGGFYLYRSLPTQESVEPGLEAETNIQSNPGARANLKRETLVAPDANALAADAEAAGSKPQPTTNQGTKPSGTQTKPAAQKPGAQNPGAQKPGGPNAPADTPPKAKPEKYVEHAGKQELRDGTLFLYDAEGLVLVEMGPFSNGQRQGFWETYAENGTVLQRGSYVDGKADGLWEGWYESGAKRYSGNKSAGQLEGQVDFWTPDGAVDTNQSGMYTAGKKQTAEGPPQDDPEESR